MQISNSKYQNGKERTRKAQALQLRSGQVTLELTAALIMVVLIVVGTVKIFVWLNDRMIRTQVEYENTRFDAGSAAMTAVDINDENQTKGVETYVLNHTALNIFE